MEKIIYVDTGALIALASEEDRYHQAAQKVFADYHKDGFKFAMCHYVLSELLTWMRCKEKIPVNKVLQFIKSFEVADIQIIGITQDLFGEALQMMAKYKDQYFSMADCVSFVVMKELKTKNVFTTDKHFSIAGYNNLLLQK